MKFLKTLKNQVLAAVSTLVLCTSFVTVSGQLSADLPGSAIIEIDSQGNMVAIWEESGLGGSVINASQRAFAGSAWSTPQQLSLQDGNSVNVTSREPLLVVNPSGEAVAVWVSIDPISFNERIYAATIALQGSATWTTATAVSAANESLRSLETAIRMRYSVKLNANNQAVVLWQTSNYNYMCSTSTVGTGNSWSAPALVVGPSSTSKDK